MMNITISIFILTILKLSRIIFSHTKSAKFLMILIQATFAEDFLQGGGFYTLPLLIIGVMTFFNISQHLTLYSYYAVMGIQVIWRIFSFIKTAGQFSWIVLPLIIGLFILLFKNVSFLFFSLFYYICILQIISFFLSFNLFLFRYRLK